MDVCREVVPQEVTFGDGVRVACHLYPHRDGAAPPEHVMPRAATESAESAESAASAVPAPGPEGAG
jgi:hypothetical protein